MSDEKEQLESEEIIENVEEVNETADIPLHHPRKVLYNYLVLGIFILLILLYVGTQMLHLRPYFLNHSTLDIRDYEPVLTGEMAMDMTSFAYRNEEYGFELRYPKVLVQETDYYDGRGALNDDLVFKIQFVEEVNEQRREEMLENNQRPDNIFVRVFETDLGLEEWLLKNYRRPDTELEDYVIGWPIVLGGEDGFYSSTGCCGNTDIAHVVKKGDFIFELGTNNSYLAGEVVQSTGDAFKFFEPAAISDWQTYRNEDYGFEIGQYIDEVVTLRTRGSQRGIGESVAHHHISLYLSPDKRTDQIKFIRFDQLTENDFDEDCIDKDIRHSYVAGAQADFTDDIRVKGIIENILPDMNSIILSCDDTDTSVKILAQ